MGRAWVLVHCREVVCPYLVRILLVLVFCHRRFGWILHSFDLGGVCWELYLCSMVEKEVLVGDGLSSGRAWAGALLYRPPFRLLPLLLICSP